MSPRFSNQSKIRNVDGLLQPGLVRRIKDSAQGDLLKKLVNSVLVGIENHVGSNKSQSM
jgi:hypothetical protein